MRINSPAGLILISAIAVAGCGSGSGSAAPAGTEGGRSSAPASSAPDSSSGPASPGPSPSSNLVLPHEDPALEARLPDSYEGNTLFKLSVGPVSSVGNEGAEPVKKLVSEIGDGTGNFGLAFANDPTATADPFNYFALRIPGAPTTQLVERYAALTVADTRGAESEQVMVAGKPVTHVTAPGNPIGDVWFYGIGDTLFGVQARTPEKAAVLLALLP